MIDKRFQAILVAVFVGVASSLPAENEDAPAAELTDISAPQQSKACSNSFCRNGGICVPWMGPYYTCSCQQGYSGLFCEYSQSSKRELFVRNGLITELIDEAPVANMRIVYTGYLSLDEDTGKENTPTQVRYQPVSVTWPGMLDDHYYTIVLIDPDMPSRTAPLGQKSQVLHWMLVNAPGKGIGGRPIAPYIGSGPPPGTGKHRYVMLAYDEGTFPKDYTMVQPLDLVDVDKRSHWNFVQPGMKWTLREFVRWANFGRPVAGNFYLAQWDPYVDQLWRTFNHFYN